MVNDLVGTSSIFCLTAIVSTGSLHSRFGVVPCIRRSGTYRNRSEPIPKEIQDLCGLGVWDQYKTPPHHFIPSPGNGTDKTKIELIITRYYRVIVTMMSLPVWTTTTT